MVYRSPETLLYELGITEPHEIDVEAIAYHCGAIVNYRHLDGCSARIIGYGDRAAISVDANSIHRRQRFSIGHELGHWERDRGKAVYLCQNSDFRSLRNQGQSPEARANEFAADLLMPAFMFKPASRNRPMTFNSVEELASLFDTSRTATAIRFVRMGSYPAMVICYGIEGRRWYQAGPDVPHFFYPKKELSHDTDAFDLLFGRVSNTRPRMADSASWIDHRDSYRYNIHEHSIKISDDEILTMLWWKDESQIVDTMGGY